jgi:chemotaxis protein MotB
MSRRKKHEEHEEHENHERWLVSYADMMTLLFVLFVVMFAMSNVEQKKFNALKAGLAAGFGQSTSVLTGSSSILDAPGSAAIEPVNPKAVQDHPAVQEAAEEAVTEARMRENQRAYAAAAAEADRLTALERAVHKALAAKGLADDVRTALDGRGLTLSLVSRHIVFESNLASLTPRGHHILETLAPVLHELENDLLIEGHTNQAPGRPEFYASDWDLSSARAITVLRWLDEREGIPEERLAAVGYGHVKPLVDPAKPGSQEVNKRVDIVVLSTLPEENHALLGQVASDRADDRPREHAPPKSTRHKSTQHKSTSHDEAAPAADAHEQSEEH